MNYEDTDEDRAAPPHTAKNHFASMKEDNWGSPIAIAFAARVFFGGPPDLDPASDQFRNNTIQAKRFLGLADVDPVRGIPINWGDARRIFINPPGGCRPDRISPKGKPVGPSFVSLFWEFAIEHLTRVEGEMIWVAYNINQLQTLQQVCADAVRIASVCVPNTRINYLDRSGEPRTGTPAASAILCVASRGDPHERFLAAYGPLGAVWRS